MKKAPKWFVSRQNYWGMCEGDGTIVEVVSGGCDYANPDMLGVKWPELGEGKEFTDPREAVEAAIAICEQWKKTDPNAHVAMGSTLGFTNYFEWEEYDVLRKKAEDIYEKLPKCDECGGLMGDENFTHDLAMGTDEKFCREYCAEENYRKQVQADLDALEKFDTVEECKAAGVHLDSCDDDGYCNHCGEQES
jgi:hypothetical protein